MRNKAINFLHLFFAWFGAVKYRNPSENLFVIGITGTSGKSTTAYLLRQLLEFVGHKVGALSTIEFSIDGKTRLNDQKMTMLGRARIQKYMREMVGAGCDIAIIETTSEGVLQYRHRFINYDTIMLTNLYPEHIESHGSFENYKAAKKEIFRYIANGKRKILKGNRVPKTAIVNGLSEYADEFLQFPFDKKIKFGHIENAIAGDKGVSFIAEGQSFHAPLFGKHNIMNIAAVIAIARSIGIELAEIAKAVSSFHEIPGRIEFIKESERFGFKIIVDYAFEPVAMKNLYDVTQFFKPKRIIHVFGGTGGGRDKARRFTVGNFVGERANICVVTNEDPYYENPASIMRDVAGAVSAAGKKEGENLFIIEDRELAIQKAVVLAEKGDIVLITGKGSEQGIALNGKIIPWDDRKTVRECLKNLK